MSAKKLGSDEQAFPRTRNRSAEGPMDMKSWQLVTGGKGLGKFIFFFLILHRRVKARRLVGLVFQMLTRVVLNSTGLYIWLATLLAPLLPEDSSCLYPSMVSRSPNFPTLWGHTIDAGTRTRQSSNRTTPFFSCLLGELSMCHFF